MIALRAPSDPEGPPASERPVQRFAPPEAPLDMPLQILERPRGAGPAARLGRLLGGLRPGRAD